MFLRKIDKMGFLRDQCKDEEPHFLAYGETCLEKLILDAELSNWLSGPGHQCACYYGDFSLI